MNKKINSKYCKMKISPNSILSQEFYPLQEDCFNFLYAKRKDFF